MEELLILARLGAAVKEKAKQWKDEYCPEPCGIRFIPCVDMDPEDARTFADQVFDLVYPRPQ